MDRMSLSRALSSLTEMSSYKIKLEQYQTDVKTAVNFLSFVDSIVSFKSRTVADLGCGNGILGIGASLLGAGEVDMYDIDVTAVNITVENVKKLGLIGCNALCADFFDVSKEYDISLANPPFGFQTNFNIESFITKLHGISNAFFVMYKHNNYINTFARRNGLEIYPLNEMRLKKTARFHKHEYTSLPVCIIYRAGK